MVEIGDALGDQESVVDQEIAGKLARRLVEDEIGGVRQDVRRARRLDHRLAAEQVLHRGGGDGGARPQRVHRDSACAELSGKAQHAKAHAEFRDGIGEVRGEPALLHVERRREHQDVRVRRLLQMRQRVFGHHVGAARIDLVHQVEALHLRLARSA